MITICIIEIFCFDISKKSGGLARLVFQSKGLGFKNWSWQELFGALVQGLHLVKRMVTWEVAAHLHCSCETMPCKMNALYLHIHSVLSSELLWENPLTSPPLSREREF